MFVSKKNTKEKKIAIRNATKDIFLSFLLFLQSKRSNWFANNGRQYIAFANFRYTEFRLDSDGGTCL